MSHTGLEEEASTKCRFILQLLSYERVEGAEGWGEAPFELGSGESRRRGGQVSQPEPTCARMGPAGGNARGQWGQGGWETEAREASRDLRAKVVI